MGHLLIPVLQYIFHLKCKWIFHLLQYLLFSFMLIMKLLCNCFILLLVIQESTLNAYMLASLIHFLLGYMCSIKTLIFFLLFSNSFIYLDLSKLPLRLQLTISQMYQSGTTAHQQHPGGFNMQYWIFPLVLYCLGESWGVFVHQETGMNHHHHR